MFLNFTGRKLLQHEINAGVADINNYYHKKVHDILSEVPFCKKEASGIADKLLDVVTAYLKKCGLSYVSKRGDSYYEGESKPLFLIDGSAPVVLSIYSKMRRRGLRCYLTTESTIIDWW